MAKKGVADCLGSEIFLDRLVGFHAGHGERCLQDNPLKLFSSFVFPVHSIVYSILEKRESNQGDQRGIPDPDFLGFCVLILFAVF